MRLQEMAARGSSTCTPAVTRVRQANHSCGTDEATTAPPPPLNNQHQPGPSACHAKHQRRELHASLRPGPAPSWPAANSGRPPLHIHACRPALPSPKGSSCVVPATDAGRAPPPARPRAMRDLEEFRGGGEGERGAGSAGAVSSSWWSGDPEAKRRRRVAGYKAYAVETRVKASLRKGFRWIKDRCTGLVRRY
ncbi:hypothetical protein PAHAL_9G020600 [Panicum hallii]|uniref:DUF3511 domain-containing protein n=1 Tax=Panicum hallii TaxID=206008 RepID=A0A2T8HZU8_9POAL|nr:hypothetical protein PAHAL_9G020600 [Panicum hallii]